MSSADIVRQVLQEKSGNVKATAQELGVSGSYVAKVKTEPLTVRQVQQQLTVMEPNIQMMGGLRDKTVEYLTGLLDGNSLGAKEAMRLLEIILQYELNLRGLAAPKLTVNDNRNQTVQLNGLVEALAGLKNPEVLRMLAGQSEVIDVSTSELDTNA